MGICSKEFDHIKDPAYVRNSSDGWYNSRLEQSDRTLGGEARLIQGIKPEIGVEPTIWPSINPRVRSRPFYPRDENSPELPVPIEVTPEVATIPEEAPGGSALPLHATDSAAISAIVEEQGVSIKPETNEPTPESQEVATIAEESLATTVAETTGETAVDVPVVETPVEKEGFFFSGSKCNITIVFVVLIIIACAGIAFITIHEFVLKAEQKPDWNTSIYNRKREHAPLSGGSSNRLHYSPQKLSLRGKAF
jgi:hypothetical protein